MSGYAETVKISARECREASPYNGFSQYIPHARGCMNMKIMECIAPSCPDEYEKAMGILSRVFANSPGIPPCVLLMMFGPIDMQKKAGSTGGNKEESKGNEMTIDEALDLIYGVKNKSESRNPESDGE